MEKLWTDSHSKHSKIMFCKRICDKYKAKGGGNNNQKLVHGLKKCSVCNVIMVLKGFRCPCCSSILRTRPKNASSRYIIRERIQ